MKRFTNCVALIFLLFQASSAADKQFTGTEAETWSLTCNANTSNLFTGTIKEEDFIVFILLSAPGQTFDAESEGLVRLTLESGLTASPTLSKLNKTQYFPRGQLSPLASAFLQLNTVGHAPGSSKAPLIGSDESMLRNWKYKCEYTKKDGLAVVNDKPPDFTVTSSTKLVCCTGDGYGAKIGGGVSFLRVAIMRAQADIMSEKAICEVRQLPVKNYTVINDSVVFFEGKITNSGACLECHVPRELGCEFKCLMINESGEKYELPLSHSFKDSQHCEKAGSDDPSSTINVPPSAVIAGIVTAIVVVVISIIIAVVVILVRRNRRRSQHKSGANNNDADIPLNDGDNE